MFFNSLAIADSYWKNNYALKQADEWYGSDEAIRVAENVLLYQRNSGGWPKDVEMHEELTDAQKAKIQQQKNELSCFDNGATTTEMRFLAKMYKRIPDSRYMDAFNRGLNCILEAQSICGDGWAQYWPKRGGNAGTSYSDFITFNDNVVVNILKMLRDVMNNSVDFEGFTTEEIRQKARVSYDKGIKCILDCQIRNDEGELTVWCAQHYPDNLLPAVARNYEMPSYSGSESAEILKFLMSIKNPSPEIIASIEGGVKWFRENALQNKALESFTNANGQDDKRIIDSEGSRLWARFTQIGGEIGRRTYEALFDYLEKNGSTRHVTVNGKSVAYRDVDNARNSYNPAMADKPIYCPKTSDEGCSYRIAYNYNDTEPVVDANGLALRTSLNQYDRTTYGFAGTWGESVFTAYDTWKKTKGNAMPDVTVPFGWGTCSAPDGTPYTLDGGWRNPSPVATVLYASGGDDRQAILDAVTKYDIVVLDGSKGDFILSQHIDLFGLQNKSILGRNNARLCTEWYITPELKQKMTDAGLDKLPDNRDGGTLSNGKNIYDASEFQTRQMLIDYTGDQKETYRHSGIFDMNNTNENIIIRNMTFVGPGSLDVSGADLISNYGGTHIWIDHCEFIDGMDGNLDSGRREGSDQYVTYTWNIFRYTDRSFVHSFSNGVGWDRGYLQYITYAYNIWGERCEHRMPQADHVKMHLLNNYYDCVGDGMGIFINGPSHTLIEGCYAVEGVNRIFVPGGQEDMFYVTRYNKGFGEYDDSRNTAEPIEMPYSYKRIPTDKLHDVLTGAYGAGATLPDDFFTLPADMNTVLYTLTEGEIVRGGDVVTRPHITLTYSEEGAHEFYPAEARTLDDTFSYFTWGNGVNGNKEGGTFYTFRPELDGTLTMAVYHNLVKPLYIEEDGVALPEYNGISHDSSHPAAYLITINVKGGSSYKLYCRGSKLGFYGFLYTWGETTDINTITTPQQQRAKGIYTITGQRLSAPRRGINIIDGKKVVVRD